MYYDNKYNAPKIWFYLIISIAFIILGIIGCTVIWYSGELMYPICIIAGGIGLIICILKLVNGPTKIEDKITELETRKDRATKEVNRIKEDYAQYELNINDLISKYGEITKCIIYKHAKEDQFNNYESMYKYQFNWWAPDNYFCGRYGGYYYEISDEEREYIISHFYVTFDYYEKSVRRLCFSVIVFESSSTILIKNIPYKFDDILSFSISDNSSIIYSGRDAISTSKTGNILGRAIVGGVIGGVAGAVVGGSTVKKDINIPGQTSRTSHNYTISITTHNLSNPIIEIHVGVETKIMQEISSILSIICERNKHNIDKTNA